MEALTKIAVLATCAAAFGAAAHKPSSEEPVIDGRRLQGYEAAVEFVRRDAAMKKAPFSISNYSVVFETGYRYHFYPKKGPNYKPWPSLDTDLGIAVRVYVDEKTLKVEKGVTE